MIGCNRCVLRGYRQLQGKGNPAAPIVVIGDCPGIEEIRAGEPFAGKLGQLLHQFIPEEEDIYFVTAVKCIPGKELKKKHAKYSRLVKHCQANIQTELAQHPRKLIIVMGNAAMWAVTNDYDLRITKARGEVIESPLSELGVYPIVHPSTLLGGQGNFRQFKADTAHALKLARGVDNSAEWLKPEYTNIESHIIDPKIMNLLSRSRELTCDLETSGFNAREDDILTIGITHQYGKCFNFLPAHLNILKQLFEDRNITWVWQNGKFDVQFLREAGIEARVDEDTLLQSYVQDERGGVHDLETIATDVLHAPNYKDMLDPYLPHKGASYSHIPLPVLNEYMAIDVSNTKGIHNTYGPRVQADEKNAKVYNKILIPGSEMLSRVETRGFYINQERARQNEIDFSSEKEALKSKMCELAGHELNPNSPQQVAKVLYDELRFPNKSKRGTGVKILIKLPQHPFVRALLKYRKCAKALSTYITPLWDHKDSQGKFIKGHIELDGRVHSNYLLHGTPTGRLASRNPNLQNIPRSKPLKGMYIATPGMGLMEVDLSQAELRVLACLSLDPTLCAIYEQDRSLHKEVAIAMYGEGYDPFQYVRAKAVNFGIVYGRTCYTLAAEFNISVAEAQRMIDTWFIRFPKAKEFIDRCRQTPVKGITMCTPFGRRKRPCVVSNARLRDFMNEASNFPPQSIASDINLVAAIEVEPQLRARGIYIVNLVHDSIICEYPLGDPALKEWAAKLIVEAQGQAAIDVGLTRIPFTSDVELSDDDPRWGALNAYAIAA